MPQHGHMAGLCSTFGTKIWDFSGVGSDFHYSYYTIMEFATKKKEKRFNINAKIPGCSTVSRGGTEYVCAFLAILTYNPMPDTARGSEFKVQCYGTVCPSCVHTTCNTMYFSKVHFGRQESFLAFGDY